MGIRTNYTALPLGTNGVGVGTIDVVVPVNVNNPCAPCDDLIQAEVVCEKNDVWNRNLCANDYCYNHPVLPGDCLDFQFQFQNTRQSRTAWKLYNYEQLPNILYTWYHYSLNPTNWTIRARIFNACTEQEFTIPTPSVHNYADDLMVGATVMLDLDRDASSRTLPLLAWYRWVQNIRFCLPTTLPAGFPEEFYFEFTVRPFSGANYTVYSQVYEIAKCRPTIQLEGVYNYTDCFGYRYSAPRNLPTRDGILFLDDFGDKVGFGSQVIAQRSVKSSVAYRNLHRFYGNAEYNDFFIEKDIPERQCFSIKTKSYPIFRVRLDRLPPYVAEIYNNNISGKVALLTGANTHPATLQVQPQGGASKSNDDNNMWYVDNNLRGCECLDYQQC
jgi:hypothetical protein